MGYELGENTNTNLSYQEKAKRNNTNSKIKSKTRQDETINVKISDIKVSDKILLKQWKQIKLTTLDKSKSITMTEKKENTVIIRGVYGN